MTGFGEGILGRGIEGVQHQMEAATTMTSNQVGLLKVSHFAGRELNKCTEDGLTACPICGARMKEEAVYSHLDVHNSSASKTLPAR